MDCFRNCPTTQVVWDPDTGKNVTVDTRFDALTDRCRRHYYDATSGCKVKCRGWKGCSCSCDDDEDKKGLICYKKKCRLGYEGSGLLREGCRTECPPDMESDGVKGPAGACMKHRQHRVPKVLGCDVGYKQTGTAGMKNDLGGFCCPLTHPHADGLGAGVGDCWRSRSKARHEFGKEFGIQFAMVIPEILMFMVPGVGQYALAQTQLALSMAARPVGMVAKTLRFMQQSLQKSRMFLGRTVESLKTGVRARLGLTMNVKYTRVLLENTLEGLKRFMLDSVHTREFTEHLLRMRGELQKTMTDMRRTLFGLDGRKTRAFYDRIEELPGDITEAYRRNEMAVPDEIMLKINDAQYMQGYVDHHLRRFMTLQEQLDETLVALQKSTLFIDEQVKLSMQANVIQKKLAEAAVQLYRNDDFFAGFIKGGDTISLLPKEAKWLGDYVRGGRLVINSAAKTVQDYFRAASASVTLAEEGLAAAARRELRNRFIAASILLAGQAVVGTRAFWLPDKPSGSNSSGFDSGDASGASGASSDPYAPWLALGFLPGSSSSSASLSTSGLSDKFWDANPALGAAELTGVGSSTSDFSVVTADTDISESGSAQNLAFVFGPRGAVNLVTTFSATIIGGAGQLHFPAGPQHLVFDNKCNFAGARPLDQLASNVHGATLEEFVCNTTNTAPAAPGLGHLLALTAIRRAAFAQASLAKAGVEAIIRPSETVEADDQAVARVFKAVQGAFANSAAAIPLTIRILAPAVPVTGVVTL